MGMSDYSYREIQIRKRTGDLSSVGAGKHQERPNAKTSQHSGLAATLSTSENA